MHGRSRPSRDDIRVCISSTCSTDCPRGLLASRAHSPGGEQASTPERHSSHNESREDQRRGEMPERLSIS